MIFFHSYFTLYLLQFIFIYKTHYFVSYVQFQLIQRNKRPGKKSFETCKKEGGGIERQGTGKSLKNIPGLNFIAGYNIIDIQ